MTERQLQFRVGLFVVVAMTILAAIIIFFGEFRSYWQRHYAVAVHFNTAPGIFVESPVKMSGVKIGTVRDIVFDQKRGGVTVLVDLEQRYRLRQDTRVQLSRSLLGDSTIVFSPGVSPKLLPPATLLEGTVPPDPMQIVQQMQQTLDVTLRSFDATSQEWRSVAQNVNSVFDTTHGRIDAVVDRAADALAQITATLATANKTLAGANQFLNDPEQKKNLRETIEALPRLVNETHQTIAAMRHTMQLVDKNLTQLDRATQPLAEQSTSIVAKLDSSLTNVQTLTGELGRFAQLAMQEDGTLKQLASDPDLYRNLNQSATSLSVLLKNLQPVVQDLRLFSDKIARHPELIGVSGALKGSSGLKDVSQSGSDVAPQAARKGLFRR